MKIGTPHPEPATPVSATESELRRSQAYLAQAQRLSRSGTFGWRPATGELVWSDGLYCILGYDRSVKPSTERVLARVHPDDVEFWRQIMERTMQGETDLLYEHRLLMPDLSVKYLQVAAQAAHDETGALEYLGVVMDVTERERAAEALRASEHLARGQLDALARTLNSLAGESDPDCLLEHMLRTVLEQAGAHSVSVWGRSDGDALLDLIALLEDDRYQAGKEAGPPTRLVDPAQSDQVYGEVLRTGQHAVLEDIDQVSARMRFGSGGDATWHRVLDDADADPAIKQLKAHLRELGVRALLIVPMMLAGKNVGLVSLRFTGGHGLRPDQIQLTRALVHQATLAIQLMRLSDESRQAAVVAERNRLARDIHDTLAQGFTGVIVQLEAAADASSRSLAAEADQHVARARELAREGLREARRSVHALRPQTLEQRDLCEALRHLAQGLAEGTRIGVEVSVQGQPRALPPTWEENLLRIGQEALTNALRHAEAAHVLMHIVFTPKEFQLRVRDDGKGFVPGRRHDGLGLKGITERVEEMGGRLAIHSAIGEGTEISVVLPIVKLAG